MEEVILRTHDLSVDFKVKRKVFGRPDILSAVSGVSGFCMGFCRV